MDAIWIFFLIISGICLATIQLRHSGRSLTVSMADLTIELDHWEKKLAIASGISFVMGLIFAIALS